jgi:hypothetical protein
MTKQKIKTFIIPTLLVIVIIIIGLVIYFTRDDDEKEVKKEVLTHKCEADSFRKIVSPGDEITFKVFLETARFWPRYRVKLNPLPFGVKGEITRGADGRGDGEVTVELKIRKNIKQADYSLSLSYEEKQEGGEYERVLCPYNLVIK